MKMLVLYRTIGYQNGTEPICGARLKAFRGNEKKCTNDAKQWIKDNPSVVGNTPPAWKWEDVPK